MDTTFDTRRDIERTKLLGMPQTQEVHDSILVTEQGHERLGEELAGGWAQMQPVGH
jgi:hypothetical protein